MASAEPSKILVWENGRSQVTAEDTVPLSECGETDANGLELAHPAHSWSSPEVWDVQGPSNASSPVIPRTPLMIRITFACDDIAGCPASTPEAMALGSACSKRSNRKSDCQLHFSQPSMLPSVQICLLVRCAAVSGMPSSREQDAQEAGERVRSDKISAARAFALPESPYLGSQFSLAPRPPHFSTSLNTGSHSNSSLFSQIRGGVWLIQMPAY